MLIPAKRADRKCSRNRTYQKNENPYMAVAKGSFFGFETELYTHFKQPAQNCHSKSFTANEIRHLLFTLFIFDKNKSQSHIRSSAGSQKHTE